MYCGRPSAIVSHRIFVTPAPRRVVIAASTDSGNVSASSLYPTSTTTVGAIAGPSECTTSTNGGGATPASEGQLVSVSRRQMPISMSTAKPLFTTASGCRLSVTAPNAESAMIVTRGSDGVGAAEPDATDVRTMSTAAAASADRIPSR